MEAAFLAHAGCLAGDSDSESIRSDISETFGTLFQRRPGSGRRKQQVPYRSPWDASVSTEYQGCGAFGQKEGHHGPSRLGQLANVGSAGSGSLQAHSSAAPAAPAAGGASGRRKPKQDLAGPCCHCGAVTSPQWRKGPKGKPILCNACGIRFLRTRTLGKSMPKKRRVATAGGPDVAVMVQVKRIKAEGPCMAEEEHDLELLAADEVLPAEDVLATDDGAEEAHSSLDALGHQLEAPHAGLLPASRLAAAAAGGMGSAAADLAGAEEEHASSLGRVSDTALLLAVAAARSAGAASSSGGFGLLGPAAAGMHQPLAGGSRHVLLGRGGHLGGAPTLALALALHNHHHQQQQYSAAGAHPQQPHSPAKVGTFAAGAAASPISNASAYGKFDPSDYSAASGSPPASPLALGATSSSCQPSSSGAAHSGVAALMGGGQQPHAAAQHAQHYGPHGPSPLSLMATAEQLAPASSGHLAPQASEVLHIVRQMTALGGVGQAIELLKAMQHGGGDVAATAAAADAAAHGELEQQ